MNNLPPRKKLHRLPRRTGVKAVFDKPYGMRKAGKGKGTSGRTIKVYSVGSYSPSKRRRKSRPWG